MKTLEDWRPVSIGRFVELINGFAFPSEGFTDGDGMPLIRIRDLNRRDTEVNFRGNYSERYVVKRGDLLIGMDGDFLTVKWNGSDAPLNQRVCKLVTKDNDCLDQEFLFYRISDEIIRIHRITAATTVKHLSSKDVLGIEIDLPCKPEQTKIAEILSMVDRAIEQTEALIAKQQRIKTGLTQELLTRGIDEHGNLRSEQTHAFKDSTLGRIPVEWEAIQLGNAASLQRGHDITENELRTGSYPVVSSSGIIGYHCAFTSEGPNVVVGRKGTIGKVHFLQKAFWAHDTSLYVTNFHGNNPRYFYYLFIHLDLARFGTKSGSPSLNRNDIHPIWIGLPSPKEQIHIADRLTACDLQMASIASKLAKTKCIKTALMQDLLTGTKRVTPLLDPETTH
jgi:type I restriction enzyme S subunit